MNKKIIALVSILVFALTAFTACGEKADDETAETTLTGETSATEETTGTEETSATEETKENAEDSADKKDSDKEETTKKSSKKSEKESEKASEQTEDMILVTYSEKTDDGEYKISLIRTVKGEYVLETADGTCVADEGAYNGCLNSFYAFDMGVYEGKGGDRTVRILLEDGSYMNITDKKDENGDGFTSIRNILTSFDENAPSIEVPEDAVG